MNRVLEEAIAKIRDLPDERQEVAAEVLQVIAVQSDSALTQSEIVGVRQAQRDVRAGKYASESEVKSFFSRFRA